MSEPKKKNYRIDTRLDAMISSEKYNKWLLKEYELIKYWGARNGYKISKTFGIVFEEFMKKHKNEFPPFKEHLGRDADEYDL